jgi:hypothetical protein
MNENIKAGADLHAGDGGYSIGTQEKYEEFVKARNYSMGKTRIGQLVKECTTYYNGGLGTEIEVFDKEKFAELIVRECMRMCDAADMSLLEHNCVKEASGTQSAKDFIKEHFGVEE